MYVHNLRKDNVFFANNLHKSNKTIRTIKNIHKLESISIFFAKFAVYKSNSSHFYGI